MGGNESWVTDDNVALLTDLYEMTMLQAYVDEGMTDVAVFSLFVRRLPNERNYLLACGLADVVTYLESLHFTDEAIDYLASLDLFSSAFLSWLKAFRFTGDVYAVAEGTPIFANEPILEVVAPITEAQLIETFVMNQICVQTVLATKGARTVTAAGGSAVVDFGARRMHGTDASIKAARAFYVAGVAATSNVLAGQILGIPVAGTMAHSFIQAHESEAAAFAAFNRLYPGTTLLVDTYDTLEGVQKVIDLATQLDTDFKVNAVRLDSGDLADLAIKSRALLDDAGLQNVGIFASGGLDEYAVAEIIGRGAPIDGFGVGTSMGVSEDAPSLDIAYKLCAYAGRGRLKLSTGKPILPGRKQVFRTTESGTMTGDVIARAEEPLSGEPLMRQVMRDGRGIEGQIADLERARTYAREQLERLPEAVRAIDPADEPYPVAVSETLRAYQKEVAEQVHPE